MNSLLDGQEIETQQRSLGNLNNDIIDEYQRLVFLLDIKKPRKERREIKARHKQIEEILKG